MDVLSDFQEHTGHPRVLADGNLLILGNLIILNNVVQYLAGDLPVLAGPALPDSLLHILRQHLIRLDTETLDHIRDHCRINFTHIYSAFLS